MIKGEIRKLCKAVDNLTEAVRILILEMQMQSQGREAQPIATATNHRLKPGPAPNPNEASQTVCVTPECGHINNDRSLCDHTRKRYQSEYNCG